MWRIALALLLTAPWQASADNRNCDPEKGLVDASCLDNPPEPPKPRRVAKWPRTQVPPALQQAIRKLSPSASVLQPSEVDAEGCDPVPRTPGLVLADFNGDGLQDAAVLLKMRIKPEVKKFNDREYREVDMLFAIFLNDGQGGYLVRQVDKFPDIHPFIGAVIQVEKPGRVKGMGGEVTLKNPGVVLGFCEKSAGLYYVQGTKVRDLPLSD